jgi:vacuolar-type H+-ATPase subunit C/Vma6
MQFALNNTFFLAIKKALNKALYKFIINNIINLLSAKTIKKITEILDYKLQVSDAIAIRIILVKY